MAPMTAVCLGMTLQLRLLLNSSVGKGTVMLMAEEAAHAQRAGKLRSKPNERSVRESHRKWSRETWWANQE